MKAVFVLAFEADADASEMQSVLLKLLHARFSGKVRAAQCSFAVEGDPLPKQALEDIAPYLRGAK